MASYLKLCGMVGGIINQTYSGINEAEEKRELEYDSCVLIQAWFRGVRVRSYLKHLNKSAVAVQRRWRGYLDRQLVRQLLKQQVFIQKLNYYNHQATTIQRSFRGYCVRKYVFNYYSRKRYFEGLKVKNNLIRNELAAYAEQQEMDYDLEQERKEKQRKDDWAKKHHYLISTAVQPGIYNPPLHAFPTEIESYLKNTKPRTPPRTVEPLYNPSWSLYSKEKYDVLPPIQAKPQGPFRDPEEVQAQRYRPFEPTLRVETDFCSLEKGRQAMKDEEWLERIHELPMLPSKSVPPVKYERLLHSMSAYGELPYGSKFFKEEFPERFISKSFQTIVPPIPILEKLNKTYSKGTVC